MWRSRFLRCAANIVDFGPHKGLTFDEVILRHPSYVEWLVQNGPTPQTRKILEYVATKDRATSSFSEAPASSSETPPDIPPIKGSDTIAFGRFEGSSFDDVFQANQGYCHFLVMSTLGKPSSDDVARFVCYCQSRWLEPRPLARTVQAPQDCLEGQSFVLVGASTFAIRRVDVRKCLFLLGASVTESVSKFSRGLLLMSPDCFNGDPVESSVAYMDAVEKEVPIIPISDFLDRLHRPKGVGCITFTF